MQNCLKGGERYEAKWNTRAVGYTLLAAENPRTSSYSVNLKPLYSANIQIYTNLPREALKDNAQFNFVIDGENFSYTHKLSK